MLSKHRMYSLRHGCPICSDAPRSQSPEAASGRAEGAGLDGEGADRATLHAPPDRRSPIITRYFSQDTLAGVLGRAAPPAQPKIAGSDRAAQGEPGASPSVTAQHENECLISA